MSMQSKEYTYKRINVPFECKLQNQDKDYFYFEGYASTFGNIDRENDVIENGAFLGAINKIKSSNTNLPALWHHKMDMPIGIYTSIEEDAKGLYVKAKLPKNDSFVSGRVIPQIQVGSVAKMSIGFLIEDSKSGSIDNNLVRLISKISEVLEISLVTIPANPMADITATKSATPFSDLPLASRDVSWSKEDALGRVRLKTGSQEKPTASYKKAFFWYDQENQENFGSYKLPFVDIIDGEMKAIPRAIFAVAAALKGARGGVDIPDADKQKIIINVNKYYSKMKQEFNDNSIVSPLEKSFEIEDFDSLKDIEHYLKEHGISNKNSKAIISKIKDISNISTQRDVGAELNCRDDNKDISELIEISKKLKTQLEA